tara:strand:+ start:368 stop:973 length:606 start_codon:yes stop_codon:yes gene_type:complete
MTCENEEFLKNFYDKNHTKPTFNKKEWCCEKNEDERSCDTWKKQCKNDDGTAYEDCEVAQPVDLTGGVEHFSMMNDNKSMNSILVFGLFVILFLFVYMYGFHGILKFEKNLNYLIAILFSGFGIILSIILIIGAIRHVSSNTMSDEEKENSRNGLLVIVVLIVFFSMMGVIRYNYGKLFNALNRTLPLNKPSKRGRKKGRK